MLEQGSEGSESFSSLSFSNETKQQPHYQSARLATATAAAAESKQEDHSSQFQQNIVNSSTVWNELLQQEEIGNTVATASAAQMVTNSAELMGTTTEKHFVSPCGFSSSSQTGMNNDSGASTTRTASGGATKEMAKRKVSSSSASYQKNNRQNGGVASSVTNFRGDIGNDVTKGMASSQHLLMAADEDYDQSFVGHLSSDENEHLLPVRTAEEEKMGNDNGIIMERGKRNSSDIREKGENKRKSGSKRASRKTEDNINKRTTTTGDENDDSTFQPKRPTSLTIPLPFIRDGKNGNRYKKEDEDDDLSPCSVDSSSSAETSSSFFLLCLSGLSRVLVILSLFSVILVVWLWFHTRVAYLEKEMGLQKERIEILVENILETERLLNKRFDFDPEEDEEEDFIEMHRDVMNEDNLHTDTSLAPPNDEHKSNQETLDIGQRFRKMLGKAQRVKRRVDYMQNQQPSSSTSRNVNVNLANYNVEFLNPKHGADKDKSGIPYDKTAGSASESGSSGPDEEWVWLTSYSRIPLSTQ